ncbi:MAG: thermonuclease family protein [Desulfovibrionaceae bacterium]|nr:thermonuclease family protein [Desulfovibrionaceae bacterium]
MRILFRALALAALIIPLLDVGHAADPLPRHVWCAAQFLQAIDGDTFSLAAQGQVVRVRLADVDAPERDQPSGDAATDRAAALLAAGTVTVMAVARDRYGRTVARVRVDGDDLAWRLVREGLAWPDCHQCGLDDRLAFGIYGVLARWSDAGLWAAAEPIRPATWRRRHRAEAKLPSADQRN